ncbi:DNA methylase [Mycobacterium phage StevieRay]|uniref:DNA methylase n=1 Tax=Mycobacterium phage StevieRay TaxID=2015811 RepID=A0A222ZLL8_9CAUD|nr:DNA methylase [Mycobacterium phage StevieRay]
MINEPYFTDEQVTLYHGDCRDVLAELADASVDAVVTDPPYGLEFMGKDWDAPWRTGNGFRRSQNPSDTGRDNVFGRQSKRGPEYFAGAEFQQWCTQWATECLRVLKPGGHMLAFGGSRTWHRLACAVEDAGFEIRDSIAWLYGSGMPKSLDVSKAIDKAAGAEREVVGVRDGGPDMRGNNYGRSSGERVVAEVTVPATDAAKQWQGWGSALKPAFEPIVVARKPLAGTVAANVLEHGTGALNIDACRIAATDKLTAGRRTRNAPIPGDDRTETGKGAMYAPGHQFYYVPNDAGRWPTNVVLDDAQAAELDAQSGVSVSRKGKPRAGANGDGWGMTATGAEYDDEGGASRFFPVFRYEAKAPSEERPSVVTTKLRLRADLTPEQVDHVVARLREAGVEID